MSGVGKPLHLRLFLEGQEVPVISAQVQAGLWAPATASIQIVPLDEAIEFKPRTMVHLFYLDDYRSTKIDGKSHLTHEDLSLGMKGPVGDVAYKLFFTGELVGFSFVKTPMSRAVVLQCLDFTSYWDSLQATMMDYGPQGNAFISRAAVFASDDSLMASVPTMGQAEKLREWILGKPKTPGLEKVAGLAGGIINMIELMGGLRGHRLGVNDFFSLAEMRCHIVSQITAEENDDTAQRLLDVQVFFDWILSRFENQAGQISLRDMLKMLCSYIYYSFVPNPVAKFDDNIKNRKVVYGPKQVKLATHRNYASAQTIIQEATRVLTTSRDFDEAAVRTLSSDVTSKLLPKIKEMKGIDERIPHFANLLKDTLDQLVAKASAAENIRLPFLRNAESAANTLFDIFDEAGSSTIQQSGGTTFISETSRLRTQLFRPDCFMAAPPTCNVIFPEQYSQITYDRSFLGEVTRVEILTYNQIAGGQDRLTASAFLEPHHLDIAKAVVAKYTHKYRVLMEHELHTGIIVAEEWLPDSFAHRRQTKGETAEKLKTATVSWSQRTGLHHFFKYRIGPRTISVAGRFMPHVVCGFPALVIQRPFYLPNDTLKKTPEDRSKLHDMILNSNNPAVELGAPPQFLGMVEGISHSLSQDGGSSSLSLSHCRSHLGIDDEFVGVVLDRVRSDKTASSMTQYSVTYEAAKKDEKLKNFLLECTPQSAPEASTSFVVEREVQAQEAEFLQVSVVNGKKTVTKKKVSVKSSAEKSAKKTSTPNTISAPDPFDAAGALIIVPASGGTVTVGSKGFHGGTVKLIEVKPPYDPIVVDGKRYFQSITVFEAVQVGFKTSSPVPVEYVVQPAWLSPSYDNENVGPKIYRPFFGCDSIVDMISLSDVGTIPERLSEKGMYVTTEEDEAAIKARLQNVHSKRNFYSIEKAVNLIAYLYGTVKSGGADATDFVETFTWRPVATKRDLLGTWDLDIGFQGGKPYAKKGALGFHSLSVRHEVIEKGKLVGLMDDPVMKLSRMNEKQKQAVAASYDVRGEKLKRVMAYVDRLAGGGRGFVG